MLAWTSPNSGSHFTTSSIEARECSMSSGASSTRGSLDAVVQPVLRPKIPLYQAGIFFLYTETSVPESSSALNAAWMSLSHGWYFTEKSLIPAENLSYVIPYSRLDEMDWEEHLLGKGWYGAPAALQFAWELSGRARPRHPSSS